MWRGVCGQHPPAFILLICSVDGITMLRVCVLCVYVYNPPSVKVIVTKATAILVERRMTAIDNERYA